MTLEEKYKSMTLLLGIATVFLMELDHTIELPSYQKERIKDLVCRVSDLIYDGFKNETMP